MPDTTIPMPPVLTEEALTSRTVGGTGLFDGLMASIGAHLKTEFEKGRISGADYSEAWIASMQAALGSAVQYLLQKDQAYYQAVLVQKQVEKLRYEIENLLPLQQAQLDLQNDKLAYEVTELLPLEKAKAQKQAEVMDAQIAGTEAQTAQTIYQTANLLPAQKDAIVADVAVKDYTVDFLLPADLGIKQKETAKLAYEVSDLLPLEKTKGLKQVDAVTAEINAITAKKDQTLYETANILPTQKEGMLKDNSIKTFQLTDVLPAQVENMTADTAGKSYNNQYLLPEQLFGLKEQNESNRAKTLDTRRDGLPVKGAIGVQKDLQNQQIDSFKRDAETKVIKMLIDAWTVQKSMDEGLSPPTSLTDANINAVMTKLRNNLDL